MYTVEGKHENCVGDQLVTYSTSLWYDDLHRGIRAPPLFSQWAAQSGQKLISVHNNAIHSPIMAAMKGHFPF